MQNRDFQEDKNYKIISNQKRKMIYYLHTNKKIKPIFEKQTKKQVLKIQKEFDLINFFSDEKLYNNFVYNIYISDGYFIAEAIEKL
jgi:hypothetical protein